MTFQDRRFLALEESRSGLDRQREDLKQVRDRIGQVFQFGALAVGVLGTLALANGKDANGWVIAGAACFLAQVALLIVVWMPGSFTFTNDAATLLTPAWDLSPEEIAGHLALYQAKHFSQNQKSMRFRMWAYTGGTLLLLAEVVCLLFAIVYR